MALDAGTAFLDILPRSTKFGANLDRQIGPQLSKTEAGLQRFKGVAAVAFVAAGAAALKFAASSVAAARDSEAATVALQEAIKRSPKLVGETTAAFQEQATALQNLTGFQDEEVLAADTILARFKLTGDQIRETTPLVLDYARASGKDVPAAADVVGKALLGNSRALKALGIEYKATGETSTDLANIQELLAQKVGGAAEAFGKTSQGKVAIFAAKLDDLKETVGAALIPIIDGLVAGLSFLVDTFSALPGPVKTVAIAAGILGVALVGIGIAAGIVRGALTNLGIGLAQTAVAEGAVAVTAGTATVALEAEAVAAAAAGGATALAGTAAAASIPWWTKLLGVFVAFNPVLKVHTVAVDRAGRSHDELGRFLPNGTFQVYTDTVIGNTGALDKNKAAVVKLTPKLQALADAAGVTKNQVGHLMGALNDLANLPSMKGWEVVNAIMKAGRESQHSSDNVQTLRTQIVLLPNGKEVKITLPRLAEVRASLRSLHSEVEAIAGTYGITYVIRTIGHQPPVHRFAEGGVINEPVIGIGQRTGARYEIGEKGPERVTPLAGGGSPPASGGGGGGSRVVVIQIDRREIARAVIDQGLWDR